MYVLSIYSFTASWLLICLIGPLCSGAEKLHSTSYQVNNPMRYEFRPIQSDEVSGDKQQYKSSQSSYESKKLYNDYALARRVENRKPLREKSDFRVWQLDQRDEETRWRDEEVMKKMNILNKLLSEDSNEIDVESKNSIEDKIIAEANMSEETKRVVRQVRKQRPGFFWTLARLAFETFNDTRSAIKQISTIVGENFEPDATTRRPSKVNSSLTTKPTTTPSSVAQNNTSSNLADANATATDVNVTMVDVNITTTMRTPSSTPPYKFTPSGVSNLLLRNLRGLVRLFNIEWQDALNQSELNVKEFQKDLGNSVGGFLQDNPGAY